jgi:hypothetical protein
MILLNRADINDNVRLYILRKGNNLVLIAMRAIVVLLNLTCVADTIP